MDTLIFLILFIGGLVVFVQFSQKLSKLEKQNRNLNERMKLLEGDAPQVTTAKVDIPTTAPPKAPPIQATPEKAAAVAATAPPVKSAPIPKPTVAKTKTAKHSLEDRIGGQWSVWVGGLALLLGAVLLIRYSIEAGFFGPGARILMAFGLGAILLAAGEWLRRSDAKIPARLTEATQSIAAHVPIPALLSAIGVFTWLGATYASHTLYGFIPATAGFIGLGVISVGAMALSLRQGPLLAIIGLLASFATPMLIEAEVPSLIGLYGYLLIIGAAALVLAWKMKWHWLSVGVSLGWLGWSVTTAMHNLSVSNQMIWFGFLGIGFAVTAWLSSRNPDPTQKPDDWRDLRHHPLGAVLWGAAASLIAMTFLTMFNAEVEVADIFRPAPSALDWVQIIAVLTALCGAGLAFRRQAAHIAVAGVVALAVLSSTTADISRLIMAGLVGAIVALMIWKSAHAPTAESKGTIDPCIIWALLAVGLGLAGPVLTSLDYPRLTDMQNTVWAGLVAVGFAAATFWFHRKHDTRRTPIYALGTAAAYALAAMFAHDTPEMLSLAFSVGVAVAGLIAVYFRVSGTRLAALALAALVFAQALLIPMFGTDNISTRPIVNELWIYLALPTALLGGLGFALRRQSRDDVLTDITEAACFAGLALFVVFQIRHLSNDGRIYADSFGFGELGLQVATGLCFTVAGLSRRFGDNKLLATLAQGVSLISLALFGLGGLILLSPLFNDGEAVTGNIAFNSLTLGFAVPTILLGICAWLARTQRSKTYVNLLGALCLAGLLSWLTAMIRFVFHGPIISIFERDFGNVELYAISAVWLMLGIVLLAAGVRWRQMALRLASAIVIVMTVLKTFLIDMAGLDGVLRPLSFVGLGIVLIVIGRAYQKYWLSHRPQD